MVKIIRKKGSRIRIVHNKKLFWVIILLMVILVFLIWIVLKDGKKTYYFLKDNECIKVNEYPNTITFSHYEKLEDCEMMIVRECSLDSECVKDKCCHASGCVYIGEKPECEDVFCTMECVSNTLDCGQGFCKCVDGKCEAVFG